jgi:carbonic anhydrase
MIDIVYRYDPQAPSPSTRPTTPSEARERLRTGNLEFANVLNLVATAAHSVRVIPFDLQDFGIADTSDGPLRQRPFAVVLGCSDARVPTELIFNQACNDLFVVRVAGNVLGSECLGSIEYAVAHLGEGLKLLVVLGHSGCGAVTAAVDAFLDPTRYLSVASSHSLRAIVDGLLVAVRAAAQALERVWGPQVSGQPTYRAALIETAVVFNAALTAATLRHDFHPVGEQQVVFGVYDLVTRKVGVPGVTGQADEDGLVPAPTGQQELGQLGQRLAGSTPVARLLRLG